MKNIRMFLAPLLLCAFATFDQGFAAQAEKYPSKPIRIVIGFPLTGGTGMYARILQEEVCPTLGKTCVVDNRLGVSGMMANEIVSNAAPDGYTFLVGPMGAIVLAPQTVQINFDRKKIAPVAYLGASPLLLVVHPSLPAKTVGELIALAKARPGGLSFASSGHGGIVHIAAELFNKMARTEMMHVPYKGIPLALVELIAGEVKVVFANPSAVLGVVKAGRLRALAVTSAKRNPSALDIATVAESGLPGYELTNWAGLFAPRGIPPSVETMWHQMVAHFFETPGVKRRLMEGWAIPEVKSIAAFKVQIEGEYEANGLIINALGLKKTQ